MKRAYIKTAFVKSIPILCSYVFVSMAYGIMMSAAGFPWYLALVISLVIYTGAFQFVLISFLSNGASLLTIFITALLMNSRQTFYSLSFVTDFQRMGRRLPYMIPTLTDETYAVNISLPKEMEGREDIMFYVALFSRCYWMFGAVVGSVLGQLIPYDLKGIDFCMTALFVIIFIDQWEKNKQHLPAIAGLIIAVICMLIFGTSNFMLPALMLVSVLLVVKERIDAGKRNGGADKESVEKRKDE